MVDTCVCCGAIIPEGRMVCPNCETPFIDNFELRKDWNLPVHKKEQEIYEEITRDKNMDAKRCDRCGEFYIPQLKNTDVIASLEKAVRKEKHITDVCDLCPNCVNKFYDWMRSANKDNNPELLGGEQG